MLLVLFRQFFPQLNWLCLATIRRFEESGRRLVCMMVSFTSTTDYTHKICNHVIFVIKFKKSVFKYGWIYTNKTKYKLDIDKCHYWWVSSQKINRMNHRACHLFRPAYVAYTSLVLWGSRNSSETELKTVQAWGARRSTKPASQPASGGHCSAVTHFRSIVEVGHYRYLRAWHQWRKVHSKHPSQPLLVGAVTRPDG